MTLGTTPIGTWIKSSLSFANGNCVEVARWVKSSLSHAKGNCAEVAIADSQIAVRNSRDPLGSVLVFTPDEWEAFIGGAKAGEFDLPAAG